MLLKSYAGDFEYAKRLIASFNEFNPESIHLYAVVPQADIELFAEFASETITLLPEERLSQYLVDHEVAGIRPGYINQEIVKIAFWELGLTENYFCVDSDAVFVRPLHREDFMFDATTPYTVLVEDNELKVEPRYYEEHWQGREPQLRKIQQLVGLQDRRVLTCHGHQIFSARVLKSLKDNFMEPREWTYEDLLEQAPYEFTWYNMWLQKAGPIAIEIREPLVKVFHHEEHELEYALRGITNADIARGYVALVVNSNYARTWGSRTEATSRELALARYVPLTTLCKALVRKGWDGVTRSFRG
jgi:hypothetical protein